MTELSDRIIQLHQEGKNYTEIVETLGCSKGTVSYHLGKDQKQKTRQRTEKRRSSSSLVRKYDYFKGDTRVVKDKKPITASVNQQYRDKLGCFHRETSGKDTLKSQESFTFVDVINKFGDNPTCYLTGDTIDYTKPSSFHFDHIHPKSRGGENTLDNLGLTTAEANILKGSLTLDELLSICEKVLKHHGKL